MTAMSNELTITELPESEIQASSEQGPEASYTMVALNATEMSYAKQGIHDFLRVKLSSLQLEQQEIQNALDEATRHKWSTTAYRSVLRRLDKRVLYYSKIIAACEAGFTIVPNMEVDVIAIRRSDPDSLRWGHDSGESKHGFRSASPTIDPEKEDHLSIGEGEYVSPEPKVTTSQCETTNDKGEKIYKVTHWSKGFEDIDFPLAIANPIVMSAADRAMRKKIFDRIGVVPVTTRKLRGDPIVLGQITLREGYKTRTASFLIAWYLDARTL